MNWISVEENLPELNSYVFVFLSNKGFQETPYMVVKFDKYGFSVSNVTHWMPLPKPPTRECNQLKSSNTKKRSNTKRCENTIDWVDSLGDKE